jgi:hypothetical protein
MTLAAIIAMTDFTHDSLGIDGTTRPCDHEESTGVCPAAVATVKQPER